MASPQPAAETAQQKIWQEAQSSHRRNRFQPGANVPAELLGAAWAWESLRAEHGPWEIRPDASALAAYYASRIEETGVIVDG